MKTWTIAMPGGVDCGAVKECRIPEGEAVQLIHLATRTLVRCEAHAHGPRDQAAIDQARERAAHDKLARERAATSFHAQHGYHQPEMRPLFELEPEPEPELPCDPIPD